MSICPLPPEGWFCARPAMHDGPCAARKWVPGPPHRISRVRTTLDDCVDRAWADIANLGTGDALAYLADQPMMVREAILRRAAST